ncbi:copper homeostasis protein CutC, partial [Flavobacteriaceae bacterium]|nr:copper homeostasis protein CutC [Flavobacteriaceae bacterium]
SSRKRRNKMILEVCANSYESAINAEKGGAHRIELCENLSVGGLTPNFDLAKKVISELNIPVFILIRPRKGDFNYSHEEFEQIKKDIILFKKIGCKGIVSGILTKDKNLDINRTKELIKLSRPLEFTFHRAFDEVINPIETLHQLIKLKVNRLLTSGQMKTAIKGIDMIKKLIILSEDKIKIMPGSGINPGNISEFTKLSLNEIHGSFSKQEKNNKSTSNINMILNCLKLIQEDKKLVKRL